MNTTCVARRLVQFGLLVGWAAAHANLIANGGFESGNTGFGTDYTYMAGDPHEPAEYALVNDPSSVRSDVVSFFDHTLGSANGTMFMGNGDLGVADIIWSQSVTVLPGATYRFSVWVASWFSPPAAELSVQINGVLVGSAFNAPQDAGEWEEQAFSWSSELAASALIEILNPSTQYTGNDFALDDLSFVQTSGPISTVPEPATVALVVVSLIGVAGTRRRRPVAPTV